MIDTAPRTRSSSYRAALLVPLAVVLAACGGAPATPALMAQSTDVFVTVSQLRTRDYDFAAHFSALVTTCANEIIANSEDDTVRRRALFWKMNAIPAARSAAFHHDPLVALYDLWALALQQRNYFTDGDGAALFGEKQPCAAAISRRLSDRALELARSVTTSGDVAETAQRLEKWAELNPIESGLFGRRSAAADISALAPQAPHKGLQAVESLEETTRDLADRITILSTDLPTESRWQAEYLINGLFEERLEEPALRIMGTVDRLNTLLDEFEPFIDDQRSSLVGAVEVERLALIDAVATAGESLQKSVASERSMLIASLHEEMAWGFAELEARSRALVDHVFVRALQLAFILFVAGLAVQLFLRRRPRNPGPKSRSDDDT